MSFDAQTLVIFGELALAAFLGAVIGFERWYKAKPAGIRTHALVAMGSALFTILSVHGFGGFADPSRVASQVVVGVGFIGAGIIFLRGTSVQGLTTAAGVWVSAAIGMAIGLGFYEVSVFTAVLAILIIFLVGIIEHRLPRGDNLRDEE
ncbi:MAG: MgtC/SapB family protein [Candidatus Niyogibacteria bacterium]|nr:MgtC/SapB family protein [Candidatus Niyogibacteria bacterium]